MPIEEEIKQFKNVIFDLDILVYQCGFAPAKLETEYPVQVVYEHLQKILHKCLKASGKNIDIPNKYGFIGFLTGSDQRVKNFRYGVLPSYKENRVKCSLQCGDPSPYNCHDTLNHPLVVHRPLYYQEVRDWLVRRWGASVSNYVEADDLCATAQYVCNEDELFDINSTDSILWSIDKDLDQVPGWHGNYTSQKVYHITPLQGLKNFYMQMLTGDRADNIPRIKKGYRSKEDEKLIKECKTEEEIYMVIYNRYHSLGLPKEDYLKWGQRQTDLLWLQRHHFDKKLFGYAEDLEFWNKHQEGLYNESTSEGSPKTE